MRSIKRFVAILAVTATFFAGLLIGAPQGSATLPADPVGWVPTFAEDFSTDSQLGSFLSAYPNMSAYPFDPVYWVDTAKVGHYDPSIVSTTGGVLDAYLHYDSSTGTTRSGKYLVAAVRPNVPSQIYGRYSVRLKTTGGTGYKVVPLLWPDSERWPDDGEIDFPEGSLNGSNMSAFAHHATPYQAQDGFSAGVNTTDWHTYDIVWSLGKVEFLVDGVSVGVSTTNVPSTPMHWVLQFETDNNATNPLTPASSGHVLVDWAKTWAPSTTPVAPSQTQAQALSNAATVSWSPVSGATGYQVWRSCGAGAFDKIATIGLVTTFNDQNLLKSTKYNYQIRAVTATNEPSVASPTATVTTPSTGAVPPTAPTGVTIGVSTTSSNSLSWTSVSNALSYQIYAGNTLVGTPTTPSFTHQGLRSGTTFAYSVVAVGLGGPSSRSSSKSATTLSVTPSTPTSLQAVANGTQGVTLTWQASSNATGYDIYKNGSWYSSSTSPSWYELGLTPGTTYSYQVVATAPGAYSSRSTAVSFTVGAVSLLPPTLISVIPGNSQVTLNWAPVISGLSPTSYLASVNGGSCTATAPTTTCTITGLQNGTSYTASVKSLTDTQTSVASNTMQVTPCTVPSAPVQVTALGNGSQVNVSWVTPTSNGGTAILGYKATITNGINIFSCSTVSGSACSISAVPSGSYSAVVTASNAAGSSLPSTSVPVVFQTAPPPAPTSLVANQVTTSLVSLTWDTVTTAASYQILRNGSLVGTTSANSFTDATVAANTTYTYTVLAANAGGTSPASAPLTLTTPVASLAAPAQVTVSWSSGTSTTLPVTWTAVQGATGYQVLRGGVVVGTILAPNTSYLDTGLLPGTKYTYTVKATAGQTTSTNSPSVTTATAPSTPTMLTATKYSTKGVSLSWATAKGATGYDIYKNGSYVGSSSTTSYIITSGLTVGTTYTLQVVSTANGVWSPKSTAVSFKR